MVSSVIIVKIVEPRAIWFIAEIMVFASKVTASVNFPIPVNIVSIKGPMLNGQIYPLFSHYWLFYTSYMNKNLVKTIEYSLKRTIFQSGIVVYGYCNLQAVETQILYQ